MSETNCFLRVEAGAGHVIVKGFNSIAVLPSQINCDYFSFLNNKTENNDTYFGEYMAQYSWAEYMTGYLETISRRI